MHGPGDIRVEDRPDPTIQEPTDAIIRVTATCVCGSDLWGYRGINDPTDPRPMGHEYCGVVEAVGDAVRDIRVGDFVVGGFYASCNVCVHCRAGFPNGCVRHQWYDGCQAELLRVPLADGTLVATPGQPDEAMVPALLTLSDVMATGWHAAVMAGVRPGGTAVVVGDGAVGLCGVLAASQLGAERVIAMSRHASRQEVARRFGATDIVEERGDEGVARIRELTAGVGADAVLECVGTGDAMNQAIACARPGAMVGFVGVPHGVELPIGRMFSRNVGVRGGMATVRTYLPDLMERVWSGRINPGLVFDLTLGLEDAAEGYRAMDERRAIKALLRP